MNCEARRQTPATRRQALRRRDPIRPAGRSLRSGAGAVGRLLASTVVVIAFLSACKSDSSSVLSLEVDPATIALPLDGRWATVALTVRGVGAGRPSLSVEGVPEWILADHPGRYAGTNPVTLWLRLVEGAVPPAGVGHVDVLVVAVESTRADAALRIELESAAGDPGPDRPPHPTAPDAPLSAEQVAFLDSVPTHEARADKIVLPNGVTLADYERANRPGVRAMAIGEGCQVDLETLQGFSSQKQKEHIICAMLRRAIDLTAPRTFPAGSGRHEPEQTRIGYVFGAKQYVKRSSAVTVNGREAGCGYLRLYGLDCSGFLKHMVDATPLVGFPYGRAQEQSDPETWKALFERNGLDGLAVERVDTTDPRDLESGDIIYWRHADGRVNHIGVVATDGVDGLTVAQSNGGRDPSAGRPCETNYTSATRGARFMSYDEEHWFGRDGTPGPMGRWEALRIVAEPEPNFAVSKKCDNVTEPDHIVQIDVYINEDEDGRVTGRGQGLDVDGKHIEVSLAASFEHRTATLSGTLRAYAPSLGLARYDIFSVRLVGDDTGFVPTINVSFEPPLPPDTGFCTYVVRLVRLEDE